MGIPPVRILLAVPPDAINLNPKPSSFLANSRSPCLSETLRIAEKMKRINRISKKIQSLVKLGLAKGQYLHFISWLAGRGWEGNSPTAGGGV